MRQHLLRHPACPIPPTEETTHLPPEGQWAAWDVRNALRDINPGDEVEIQVPPGSFDWLFLVVTELRERFQETIRISWTDGEMGEVMTSPER